MSRPRVSRTVTRTPFSLRTATNRAKRAGEAGRRDGHVASAEADAGGIEEERDGAAHVAVVPQRLAHAHEHDIGRLPLAHPRRPDDLRRDLAGAEVALQAHLRGGAEGAPHA